MAVKKRWIALAVGLAGFGAVGYIAWREALSGGFALSRRDYPAERALLIEKLQTEAGRAPGAPNALDAIDAWTLTSVELRQAFKTQWAPRGGFPGFGVPPREGGPRRTDANKADMAAADEAAAQYYAAAVKAGLLETLAKVESSPRAARAVTGSVFAAGPDQTRSASLRELARLCRYRMQLAAAANDDAAYRVAAGQALRLATVSAMQPTVVERLVAVAVLALVEGGVREDLATGKIHPALAAEIASRCAEVYGSWPPWSAPFEGEAIDGLELLSRNARLLGASEVSGIERGYKELARGADLPRAQRLPVYTAIDNAVASAPVWHTRIRILLPALTAVGRSKDQIEADTAGLVAITAVERFKADKGALPESLDSLVPGYLAALPADPFGTHLKYKRLERPDALGRSYIIYSVGFDGVDNGGTVSPKGVFEALKKDASANGFDFPVSRVDD